MQNGARVQGTEPLAREAVTERAEPQTERQWRAWQREEFGGFSKGSVFFGWLVAAGVAAILGGIGAAAGLADLSGDESLSDAALATAAAILVLAHFAGGYVAGRLARFDGTRQGAGIWLLGLLTAAGLTGLAAASGTIDDLDLTTTGAIAIAATVLISLLAALAGGTLGERFHHKVDRVAFEHPKPR